VIMTYEWPKYTATAAAEIGRYQLFESAGGALYRIDTVEGDIWRWTGKMWRMLDEEPEEKPAEGEQTHETVA